MWAQASQVAGVVFYVSFGHLAVGVFAVTEVTGGTASDYYRSGTVALLTFFLLVKQNAASNTVMLGAIGQTFYFCIEEVPQGIVRAEVSDSDSVGSTDSWEHVN